MALRAVHEDGNGEQYRANWHLSAGEDRAGRDAKLMLAAFAFKQRAGFERMYAEATATRTRRVAIRGVPTDLLERLAGFVVAHARDRRQTERPGRCAEKEVLRHFDAIRFG